MAPQRQRGAVIGEHAVVWGRHPHAPVGNVPVGAAKDLAHFRMAVQRGNRPDASFRGYNGTVARGVVRPATQAVATWAAPSGADKQANIPKESRQNRWLADTRYFAIRSKKRLYSSYTRPDVKNRVATAWNAQNRQ